MIFGNILWDGPGMSESCVVLSDIHIDINPWRNYRTKVESIANGKIISRYLKGRLKLAQNYPIDLQITCSGAYDETVLVRNMVFQTLCHASPNIYSYIDKRNWDEPNEISIVSQLLKKISPTCVAKRNDLHRVNQRILAQQVIS